MECTYDHRYLCYDELGSLKDYLIENVQVERQIDKGAYGRIMEAKWEGTIVAVKEIHSIFNDVSDEQFVALKARFLNECRQISQLRHPSIVRFLGIYLPTGARIPSLVMERLHCNLTKLLEQDPIISLEIKLSILHQTSLGLRYLHTRTRPVIHRDLSSNNILISKGMEAKITDFGTVRILEPNKQTPMSLAPGTQHFMPPEALLLVPHQQIEYKEEIDIFSFGCVILHTFSHKWPYPLVNSVIVDPVSHQLIPQSEIQRREKYFEDVPKEVEGTIIPLVKRCLENHPGSRPSAEEVCKQLEPLVVNRRCQLAENRGLQSAESSDLQMQLIQSQTTVAQKHAEMNNLRAQLEEKCAELNNVLVQLMQSENKVDRKTAEINCLQSRLASVNRASSCEQVNLKNIDFWRSLNPVWTQCADLPEPYWITSVAELDGNVYVTPLLNEGGLPYPLKYDSRKNQWSRLPIISTIQFALVAIPGLKQLVTIGGLSNSSHQLHSELVASDKVFVWNGTRWISTHPYGNMPTARFQSSAVCYQSKVIVVGGVIKNGPPRVMTRAVEILDTDFAYWSKVEQLPYISNQPSCLLVDDLLYVTVGFNKVDENQTNIAVASLPALLENHPSTSGGQIWEKLPDLPYPSPSINVCQKRLVTFGGIRLVEQSNRKPAHVQWQLVPLIHVYNPGTRSWDCVGKIEHQYYLGRSVHIGENKVLFIGGTIGKYITDSNNDLVTTCCLLTVTCL